MAQEFNDRLKNRLAIVGALSQLPNLPDSGVKEVFQTLTQSLSSSGMQALAEEARKIASLSEQGVVPDREAREAVAKRIVNWLNSSSTPGVQN